MAQFDKIGLILFILFLWFAAMGLFLACMAGYQVGVWNGMGPELTTANLTTVYIP